MSFHATPPIPGQTPEKKQTGLTALLGGGKTYFLLAVAFAVLAMIGTFMILGRSAERSTYYVLGQDIPARTQVTAAMLLPVDTAAGTEPANALTPADVSTVPLFSQVPLRQGEPVTSSVVGRLTRIDDGIPKDYVVASFKVQPENAVAGKVRRGDLIDMIGVFDDQDARVAKTFLHRVLVLDVTTDPSTIAQGANDSSVATGASAKPGPESNAVRGGIPLLYTVAVTPTDAAKLALARDKNVMVTLSSNQSNGRLDVTVDERSVFGMGSVDDSSQGIDLPDPAASSSAPAAPAEPQAAAGGATAPPAP